MILHKFKPSMQELAPFICDAIENGQDVRLTVTGYSMYPLLRSETDSVILTKPQGIRKYDVVLFRRANGRYILHRVIAKRGNILTIAGDNETHKEYPVEEASVLAKMKGFCRGSKKHSTKEMWYRFYSKLWLLFFPFRGQGAKAVRFIGRFRQRRKQRKGIQA